MLVTTFKEIIAWQKAHELAQSVYKLISEFPKFENVGLSSQMRRCAISIPSNIAEGFKRRTKNDSVHFYNVAEGSLEELKSQLLLAKDLKYIKESDYNKISNKADEVGRVLYGWKKVQK